MTENYKHLYEQTKKMLTMYQDELIPGFRKQIEKLESTVVNQRKRADTAEDFICTMCAECKWEVNDGILIMQKACCAWFPECHKFKLRPGWIPVTERLPSKGMDYLCRCIVGNMNNMPFYMVLRYILIDEVPHFQHETKGGMKVTHWMPLPEPPKEENHE